jgi:hypothetical protein
LLSETLDRRSGGQEDFSLEKPTPDLLLSCSSLSLVLELRS